MTQDDYVYLDNERVQNYEMGIPEVRPLGHYIPKPEWAKWAIGKEVTKVKGSQWTGRVVGYYSTHLTPKGYAIESNTEIGSVQIYPEAALREME